MSSYKEQLDIFTEDSLPDLDTVVLGALELLGEATLPDVSVVQCERPLVVGSVNGEATGRLLFEHIDAIFANESNYKEKLARFKDTIDGVVIISASGSKHAIEISTAARALDVPVYLYTNNPEAPAKEGLDPAHVFTFPKNREPYTYNTSTYMSMFEGHTHEDVAAIQAHIEKEVVPQIPSNLDTYSAFCLVVPSFSDGMRSMFTTKFDELFGPRIAGRVFTFEQMKHAKTVIQSDTELFILFGREDDTLGDSAKKLHIPLPNDTGLVAMMAIGYFVIGQIQKQHPPYFKQSILNYTERASGIFGHTIPIIVE